MPIQPAIKDNAREELELLYHSQYKYHAYNHISIYRNHANNSRSRSEAAENSGKKEFSE